MELEHVKPAEIEKRSFEILTEELAAMGIVLAGDTAPFIKRAIHTTADFEYARTMHFSENAVAILKDLIRSGATIVTDTNMGLSGINKTEAARHGCEVRCFMADPEVAAAAKELGITRAAVSIDAAAKLPGPVIFACGNAPTALVRLRELYDAGTYHPAFVIGVPVGFVNVEAAKELIAQTDIPCIVNLGRKGGSNVAAALCNAALYELRREEGRG